MVEAKCTKCDATLIEAEHGQELCIRCVKDSDTGLRYNEGKLPYDLIPFEAEEGLAQVLAHGAKKYAERNWEKGMDWSIPYGAMRRHLAAWWNGETTDKESGLPHMAHVLCNAAFLIAYEKRQIGTDNRPQIVPPSDVPATGLVYEDDGSLKVCSAKDPVRKIEDGLKDLDAVQRAAETPRGFRAEICHHCHVPVTGPSGEALVPAIIKMRGGEKTIYCVTCFNVLHPLKKEGAH